jgi:hypothetical protein
MATMTPTTANVFIPDVWAKDILMARRNKLVATNLVDHQYENVLKYGDTVHITSIAEMTADAITPGTALVPVAPTETEQTLLINQYYGKAIEIQDMVKVQSMYDLRAPYADVMAFALAKSLDASILGQWTNVVAGNQQTAVAALTFNGIVDATTLLDAANVPQTDRALIVDAVSLGDLRKLTQFTSWSDTGRAGVREDAMGIVGEIYGAPVYLSNAIANGTTNVINSSTNHKNMLVHKSAFAAAIQKQPEMESDRDILKKTDLVSTSMLWGVKTIRNDHAVVLART